MDQLIELLTNSSEEERNGLARILDISESDPHSLVESIQWNSQSIFGYIFNSNDSYKPIVRQVADKLGIEYKKYDTVSDVEKKIAQKILETVWEKMTPEQRKEMEEELRKTAKEFDKSGSLATSASMFAALTAANLSGFGIYLAASTALGAITSFVGITLPFAVYTTMSSAIAVAIGPVGWIGMGLFAIWSLTGPNYKKLIPAILYVSLLRNK